MKQVCSNVETVLRCLEEGASLNNWADVLIDIMKEVVCKNIIEADSKLVFGTTGWSKELEFTISLLKIFSSFMIAILRQF